MPYRPVGDRFVGREEDLRAVDDILREKQTVVVEGVGLVGVVVGMSGIGKTQLAIEYAHRFGVNYPGGVFWVDAERGISTLIGRVSECAEIEVDQTLSEQNQLDRLWRGLHPAPPVLIVLDNFPENEKLNPWLPPAGPVHILVTTRRRDLSMFTPVPLDFLTPDEGLILLNKGQRQFGDETKKLVEALGGLPLALELARHFLNLRPDLTIDGLLQDMAKMGVIKALKKFAHEYGNELPTGHTKEVAATIQMSWNLASDQAKSVLRAMACLAPTPVPRRLLRKIVKLPSENRIEDPLDEAVSELAIKLSLVELDDENDPSFHRLIASFVKTAAKGEYIPLGDVAQAVGNEMARASVKKDTLSYRELAKVTPHAEHLAKNEKIDPETFIKIAEYTGWHLKELGYSKKSFKPEHPTIALRKSKLASVLKELGEFEERGNYRKRVIKHLKKVWTRLKS